MALAALATETSRLKPRGYHLASKAQGRVEDRRIDGHGTMSSLKDLQSLVHEKFGIEESALDPNASMREKGFDSLTLVEFLFAIEDRFGISMSDEDANIDTLAQLAAAVDKLVAAKAA